MDGVLIGTRIPGQRSLKVDSNEGILNTSQNSRTENSPSDAV